MSIHTIIPPIKYRKKSKVIFLDRITSFDKNLKIFFQLFNRLGNKHRTRAYETAKVNIRYTVQKIFNILGEN